MTSVYIHETFKSSHRVAVQLRDPTRIWHHSRLNQQSWFNPRPLISKPNTTCLSRSSRAFSVDSCHAARRPRRRSGDEDEDDDDEDESSFAIATSVEAQKRDAGLQEWFDIQDKLRREFARKLEIAEVDGRKYNFHADPPPLHEAQATLSLAWAKARAVGQKEWDEEILRCQTNLNTLASGLQLFESRMQSTVELARAGDLLEEKNWVAWDNYRLEHFGSLEAQFATFEENLKKLKEGVSRVRYAIAWWKWRTDELLFRSKDAELVYDKMKSAEGDHEALGTATLLYAKSIDEVTKLLSSGVAEYVRSKASTDSTQPEHLTFWSEVDESLGDSMLEKGHLYRSHNMIYQLTLRFPDVVREGTLRESNRYRAPSDGQWGIRARFLAIYQPFKDFDIALSHVIGRLIRMKDDSELHPNVRREVNTCLENHRDSQRDFLSTLTRWSIRLSARLLVVDYPSKIFLAAPIKEHAAPETLASDLPPWRSKRHRGSRTVSLGPSAASSIRVEKEYTAVKSVTGSHSPGSDRRPSRAQRRRALKIVAPNPSSASHNLASQESQLLEARISHDDSKTSWLSKVKASLGQGLRTAIPGARSEPGLKQRLNEQHNELKVPIKAAEKMNEPVVIQRPRASRGRIAWSESRLGSTSVKK